MRERKGRGIIDQNGEPSGRETRGDPGTPAAARSESENEVRRRDLPSTSSQRLTPHSRTARAASHVWGQDTVRDSASVPKEGAYESIS